MKIFAILAALTAAASIASPASAQYYGEGFGYNNSSRGGYGAPVTGTPQYPSSFNGSHNSWQNHQPSWGSSGGSYFGNDRY